MKYAVWYASVGCLPDSCEPEYIADTFEEARAWIEANSHDYERPEVENDLYRLSIDTIEDDGDPIAPLPGEKMVLCFAADGEGGSAPFWDVWAKSGESSSRWVDGVVGTMSTFEACKRLNIDPDLVISKLDSCDVFPPYTDVWEIESRY